MFFSIRKKMLRVLLVIILLLLACTGFIGVYNQTAYYKSQQRLETISLEMKKVASLNNALISALMPANDYIITGDRKYKSKFQEEAETIEGLLKDIELFLNLQEKENTRVVEEEKEILSDIRVSWENVRKISLMVFAIPEPVGTTVATKLMEELDYYWGFPATIRLVEWHEIDLHELEEAIERLDITWWRSWLIIGAFLVILTIGGLSFAFFYSDRFVRPIKELHNGADRIAGGDLDYRVVIRTGDEIEQLANQFNIMGDRLKESYSMLEERVRERTKELNARLNELERFKTATIGREFRIKKLRDKNKTLMEKLERLEKEG